MSIQLYDCDESKKNIQNIIDHFKIWLEKTTEHLRKTREENARQKQRMEEENRRVELERLSRREKILANVKI